MTARHPLVALFLSLCLLLGAVTEAVARSEMAGMSDLVLCGAGGASVVTLDAQGRPVQRHPCTHCLAAGHLALIHPPQALQPPVLLNGTLLRPALSVWQPLTGRPAPLARGPPTLWI